jgi:phosphatidylglycerophosphatase C
MVPLAARDLVDRLEGLVDAAPAGVLAFDADGTLWTGDVGDDFYEAMLAGEDFLREAEDEIRRELERAGLTAPERGAARTLLDAYNSGNFDEEHFYEIVGWAAAGRTRDEVAAYADRIQAEGDLDARLQREVEPVLAWAARRRVDVFVVSASPRIVVQRGATRLSIPAPHVFGAQARFDGDRMLPEPVRPIPYGPGKVTALRAAIGTRPILAAFGDNVFDLPMLSEAQVPVVVRPKPRLLARRAELTSFFILQETM